MPPSEKDRSTSARRDPKWTVVFNGEPIGDASGSAWEFFDNEDDATRRFDALSEAGRMPTKRPFFAAVDRAHMPEVQACPSAAHCDPEKHNCVWCMAEGQKLERANVVEYMRRVSRPRECQSDQRVDDLSYDIEGGVHLTGNGTKTSEEGRDAAVRSSHRSALPESTTSRLAEAPESQAATNAACPASPTPASDYDAGLATAERIVRSLAKHNADRSKDSRDVRGLIAGALYAAADDIGSAIFTHPQHPQEARPTSAKPDETRRYRALLAEAALLLRDTDPDSAEHAVRLAKTIDKTLRAEQARLKENE